MMDCAGWDLRREDVRVSCPLSCFLQPPGNILRRQNISCLEDFRNRRLERNAVLAIRP